MQATRRLEILAGQGVKRQQQERKSLEDDYDMERKGLREEIKVLEDERSETLAARDLLQEELSTASTSLEAQQKHGVELKKELGKPPGRAFEA